VVEGSTRHIVQQTKEPDSPSNLQVKVTLIFLSVILIAIFLGSGNAIGVYGALPKGSLHQSIYSIDNGPSSTHNSTNSWSSTYRRLDALYAVSFYESPLLDYGPHKLNVTVDRYLSTGDKPYIFEFLTVGVRNEVGSDLVIVDDMHPAVQYDGDWVHGSFGIGYNETTTRAKTSGASARFTFYGDSIDVYGAIKTTSDATPVAKFRVDDGLDGYYSLNSGGELRPKTRLYYKEGLSLGSHTLQVDALTSSQLWLDYFIYTTPTSNNLTVTAPISSKSSKASLIGGVLGGIAGLVLLAFLLFLLYRRRKRSQNPEEDTNKEFVSSSHPKSLGSNNNAEHSLQPTDERRPTTSSALLIDSRYTESSEISGGNGDSSSRTRQSISPTESFPVMQHNIQQNFVGPLPQKYRPRQAQPVAPPSEHGLSNDSTYTDSNGQEARYPPPYSER
jgi:hypothetical protein